MPLNSRARRRWFGFIILAAISGVLIVHRIRSAHPLPETNPTSRSQHAVEPKPPSPATTRSLLQQNHGDHIRPSSGPNMPGKSNAALRIHTAMEDFRQNRNPESAAAILRKLREDLSKAPEHEVLAAIVDFLQSGADAPTGLPFIVGPDGMMELVPSLRTALLDLLPSLDPFAALDSAKTIMDKRASPDEYALALRNMAWNDLDGDLRDELTIRFRQMIEMDVWVKTPSSGFLEAFDISLQIAGPPIFHELVEIARKGVRETNGPLTRAAFISLDRMVLRDPSLLISAHDEDPGWMDFAPKQRASLMSRLDITEPAQRALFIRYLSSISSNPQESAYFAEVFPNGNYLCGHRLTSSDEPTPSIAERAEIDRLILNEVESLANTTNAPSSPALLRIRERLHTFLGTPGNPPPNR